MSHTQVENPWMTAPSVEKSPKLSTIAGLHIPFELLTGSL
jgi:hypothetical protein